MNESEKVPRMKVDEPKTPYHANQQDSAEERIEREDDARTAQRRDEDSGAVGLYSKRRQLEELPRSFSAPRSPPRSPALQAAAASPFNQRAVESVSRAAPTQRSTDHRHRLRRPPLCCC